MSFPLTSLECMSSGGSHGVSSSSWVSSSCTMYVSDVRVRVILRMVRMKARTPAGPYISILGFFGNEVFNGNSGGVITGFFVEDSAWFGPGG
jgi:hypothetical protein